MKKEKRPVGRPSSLSQEHIDGAVWYLKGGFEERGEVVPSIAGLACFLGVSRDQIYDWGKRNIEFRYTLEAIKSAQEVLLVNKGLQGDFNPTIAKLMMANHGYSDKVENNLINSDGSLKPEPQLSPAQFAQLTKELLEKV